MSVYRRRYNRNEIIRLKFDYFFRQDEESKYILTTNDEITVESLMVFFNFIVLCSIISYRDNKINESTCNKIIDEIDGYFFAFEEGLLNEGQLYSKFKKIMEEDFCVRDWNYKVVYEGVKNDYIE